MGSLIPLAALAARSGVATAQEQGICFEDTIPLMPTNRVGQTLTVSKFDTDLGILTGIGFTLEGTAEGSAGVESLDATATTVMTAFQATLTLERPDMTEIVVVIPAAMFSDDLTAFDGILDFGGTTSILNDDLLLFGSNLIPNQSALLFSADMAFDNCVGRTFGDGRRCAGVNLLRLGVMLPDAGGNVTFGPGRIALEDAPLAGDTRRYQLWYRDPSGPCNSGFNLTNGYAITCSP